MIILIIIIINFVHYHAGPTKDLNFKVVKKKKKHFEIAFSCFMFINNYKFEPDIEKYVHILNIIMFKYLKVYYETHERFHKVIIIFFFNSPKS